MAMPSRRGCVKFDMLLVVVPTPVLSASATLPFGIVFMQGGRTDRRDPDGAARAR